LSQFKEENAAGTTKENDLTAFSPPVKGGGVGLWGTSSQAACNTETSGGGRGKRRRGQIDEGGDARGRKDLLFGPSKTV